MLSSIDPATRRGAVTTNYRRDDEEHKALLKRKRIGLNDSMSVVTRFVNACNRHDADGVAACLHPDFDSIQPMHPTRNFRGADQVRRNWQAIFDAEPGFRLTVLRSASADDTVWLELHGAGRDAEVAGVFVMGIQGDRIRWARIYSALVEPVPAGSGGDAPAPLQQVPPPDSPVATDVVSEALIAPVVDIDRSSRRRDEPAGDEPAGDDAPIVDVEIGWSDLVAEADEVLAGDADAAPADDEPTEPADDAAAAVDDAVVIDEAVTVEGTDAGEVTVEDAVDDGPPTEAVEVVAPPEPPPFTPPASPPRKPGKRPRR